MLNLCSHGQENETFFGSKCTDMVVGQWSICQQNQACGAEADNETCVIDVIRCKTLCHLYRSYELQMTTNFKNNCFVFLKRLPRTGQGTKTDEFSEKFQTAFDPPPHFRKVTLRFSRQNCDKSAYVHMEEHLCIL